jgi:hypothetical protein
VCVCVCIVCVCVSIVYSVCVQQCTVLGKPPGRAYKDLKEMSVCACLDVLGAKVSKLTHTHLLLSYPLTPVSANVPGVLGPRGDHARRG